MSKIFYKTGVMGSGKTLDLARVNYNYKERGMEVLIYKPKLDTREGTEKCLVRSRALGYDISAEWIPDNIVSEIGAAILKKKPSVIIVDESQFLTKEQVDDFQKLCFSCDIPIIFYGLKTTFQGELFEGSKRIIEIADKVEEFKSMCHCGKVARQNARVIDNKVVTEGDVVAVGGNELYISLCNKCFVEGNLGGK